MADTIIDGTGEELPGRRILVKVGTRGEAVANVGYALGRVAGKLVKATREKMSKT